MNSVEDDVATELAAKASSKLFESHQKLRYETRERLKHLLAVTPSLRDLNCDITPDEITAEIAIIHGDSIKVYVTREPYHKLKVIVPKTATVRDFKVAVRRCFNASQNRQRALNDETKDDIKCIERRYIEPIVSNISWKYIWRTFYLQSDTDILMDDEKTLDDYNIHNKCVLKFVKKIKIDRRLQTQKLKMHK